MAIIENGARNADGSCGAYKFPIQEGRLLSMMAALHYCMVEWPGHHKLASAGSAAGALLIMSCV